jgi:hypothetical protein
LECKKANKHIDEERTKASIFAKDGKYLLELYDFEDQSKLRIRIKYEHFLCSLLKNYISFSFSSRH